MPDNKTCNCGVKKSCGRKGKVQGGCVEIDITFPDKSSFSEAECKPNANEVLEDVYELVCDASPDFSKLKDSCIDYGDCDNLTIDEFICKVDELLQEQVKAQEEEDTDTENGETSGTTLADISTSDINTGCLEDDCENGLGTAELLIQSLINKLCEKCDEIETLTERVLTLEGLAKGEEVVIPQARTKSTTKKGFLGTPKNT